MPDLEIHNSQNHQNNFGYENYSQNRDEQQFSNHKSSNLFYKINWVINIIDIPTHKSKVWWKEISKNHLEKSKTLRFSWWFYSASTIVSLSFSFSLLFISLLSSFPFFSLSPMTPEGYHALNPLVWSTKEAKGGINLPPPQVNRLEPFLFLLFCRDPVDQ